MDDVTTLTVVFCQLKAACVDNNCHDNATCVPNNSGSYECRCHGNQHGNLCIESKYFYFRGNQNFFFF